MAGRENVAASHKGETLGGQAEGFEGQDRQNTADFPPSHSTAQLATDKRFATLRAELALRGHALRRTDTDEGPRYLIARWGMTRELRDLAAVARFLEQVGGVK